MKIVILAGGGGTRLWPLSRKTLPKQFTKILSNKILLQETVDRFTGFYSPKDIYISLTPELLPLFKKKIKGFPEKNLIIEPEKRDTGPAMGYAAMILSLKFPDEPIIFVPSDHYIYDLKKYLSCLRVASKLIKEEGKLIDIAIPATFASTVLGYTQVGKVYKEINGVEVYRFRGHTEKPDFRTAKKYLAAGNYWWHGNCYMWTPAKFLGAYEKYAPNIYRGLMKVKEAYLNKDEKNIKIEYSKLEKISIDYAITEKIDPAKVLIIKGEFGWSDIGAWDVVFDKLSGKHDENKNLIKGLWAGLDTTGSLVYGSQEKIIATVGVDDLIVVDTPDALLICPKSRAQDVKKIVEKLAAEKKKDYL